MRPKILVIEDEDTRLKVYETALHNHGYEVKCCTSGSEGYVLLTRHEDFDLVLLDTKLTDVNSLDLLRIIRRRYNRNLLPIIMLSGLNQSEAIVESLEAGANDYMTTFGNIRVLLARIRVLLRMRDSYRTEIRHQQHRVMHESLGAACHHLSQPLTLVATRIDLLVKKADREHTPDLDELKELQRWIRASTRELERLNRVTQYRTTPYFGEARILDLGKKEEEASAETA
ncbi:response regulator transcription factor [Coraliomargarita parva]|uniref:response regulator transcription factor n=1 Tax=Coraliomargarita parva TaxID=3014050 RepID=UPI0022B44D09|nr:response regulator [Coraliomargarita parva]